jgi:hypothetical protein
MKTSGKVKAWMAAAIIALTGSTGFANTNKGPAPGRFEKENQAIHQDLLRIGMHRDHIKFLKEKMKDDRAAGKKTAVIMDKRDIRKTKADLRREKCYVKADKKDLKCDRKLAIKERKDAIRDDKKKLADAKKQLAKDKRLSNAGVSTDQRMVDAYKTDLERDRSALKEEVSDYSSNMVVVNKSIRKSKAEFFVFNYAEGGMAGISNWMRK